MQEHVKLEVALEIVMAEIAEKMFKLDETSKSKNELEEIIKIQEDAYKAEKPAINKILGENNNE